MKTNNETEPEMLDDYSHLAATARRHDPRFTPEKVLNAPIYVIGTDGVRRRKASLHQLQAQLTEYTTKDFEVVIEALKIIARERGEAHVQDILTHCEHELVNARNTFVS